MNNECADCNLPKFKSSVHIVNNGEKDSLRNVLALSHSYTDTFGVAKRFEQIQMWHAIQGYSNDIGNGRTRECTMKICVSQIIV